MKTEYIEPPEYLIDSRLKGGRDYPKELEMLIAFFHRKAPFPLVSHHKALLRHFRRKISSIEKAFKEWFINPPGEIYKPIKINKPLSEMTQKEYHKVENIFVHKGLINRINRHLKKLNPALVPDGLRIDGYKLAYTSIEAKKAGLGESFLWELLAKVIDSETGLDRNLFHQCPFCRKIFISRQRKKYHPQCRVKYLSENYRESGKAKINLQRFRARQKKKTKRPEMQD